MNKFEMTLIAGAVVRLLSLKTFYLYQCFTLHGDWSISTLDLRCSTESGCHGYFISPYYVPYFLSLLQILTFERCLSGVS